MSDITASNLKFDIIRIADAGKEVIRIAPDGKLFWHQREVETDVDFRAAMIELGERLAPRARPTEERAPQDDVPLRCEVIDGAIQFAIGAKILAHATNIAPNLYDAENDRGLYRVTEPVVFAKAVARELDRESEDGSTPLTRLLDGMVEEAINQGAEGVEEHGDGGPKEKQDGR